MSGEVTWMVYSLFRVNRLPSHQCLCEYEMNIPRKAKPQNVKLLRRRGFAQCTQKDLCGF